MNLFIPFKILVFDDDDVSRKSIITSLVQKGYDLKSEKNTSSVSRTVEREMPDLIICSLDLPKNDSMFFLKKFRKDDFSKNIPIICHTARPERKLIPELQSIGIRDVLLHPIEETKLYRAVEKYYKIKVIAAIAGD